jgi:protein-S-isoprenylcysteine O-methyltransferase Ste14
MDSFYHLTAVCILAAWPVIPLFWVPVHLFHGFLRRRLGLAVYAVIALIWLPCLWFVREYGDVLLQYRLSMPLWISAVGCIIFAAGLALQSWTAWVMGSVIIGVPEVTERMESRHVIAPPFNWCRHPTYLSHSMIFGGAAVMTGYIALFILAAVDFIITRFIIIPFEEKELLDRLGTAYMEYMEKTPRLLPQISRVIPERHGQD